MLQPGAYLSPYQHGDWPGLEAGLRAEDILLSADSLPVTEAAVVYRRIASLDEGATVRYEVLRGARRLAFDVRVSRYGMPDLVRDFIGLFVVAWAFLLVGLVCAWLRPLVPGARGVFLVAVAVGTWGITYFDANTTHVLAPICMAGVALMGGAFLYTGLVFPRELPVLAGRPWLRTAPLAISAVLAVAGAVGMSTPGYVVAGPERFGLAYSLLRMPTMWLLLGMVSFIVLMPFHFWRAGRGTLERQQAGICMLGVALAFVPGGIMWGAGFLLNRESWLTLDRAVAFIFLFPASIAYAILRHRLFDISVVIRRSVLYTLLTVILGAVYIAVSTALRQGILLGVGWQTNEAGLVATAIVVALFVPLRDRLRLEIDRRFFREAYDAKHIVEEVAVSLTSMVDLDRITFRILQGAQEALHASSAAIYLPDAASGTFKPVSWANGPKPAALPLDHPAVAELSRGEILTRVVLPVQKRHRVSDQLDAIEADVVVPLLSQGAVTGFVSLGPKLSEKAYDDSDLALLVTLANQGTIAISNALRFEELQRTRDSLARADKLAALGKLASGVAHELNSPLMVVGGELQLIEKTAPGEGIDRIRRQVAKMKRIIGDLLDFARPAPAQLTEVDPVALVDRVVGLLRVGDGRFKNVLVRTDLGSSQPQIFGDSSKLEQVFINLLTNAAHAAADRDVPEIRLSASERDGFLVIAVEDNGCGIPEADRGRIFDPFYTTKRVGEGTGLGLSVSFGIVEEHRGFIEVESHEGEGTKMSVGIPLAPARAAALAGG